MRSYLATIFKKASAMYMWWMLFRLFDQKCWWFD